jgi:hypothetical protein
MSKSETLARLVAAGNFRYAHELFDVELAYLWPVGMGDRQRGEFVVVTMKASLYNENAVLNRIARLRGNVVPATAYELLVFASSRNRPRWNGQDKVMAFGSKATGDAVPMLEFDPMAGRFLTFEGPNASGLWRNDRYILCVKT